jgi:hypothetical protein
MSKQRRQRDGPGEQVSAIAGQVANSAPGEAVAAGYNAGQTGNQTGEELDEGTPSEEAGNLGSAIGGLVSTAADPFEQAASAVGALMEKAKDDTRFTRESTSHGNAPNGQSGLPLMSEAGKRLASKAAPTSAFNVRR